MDDESLSTARSKSQEEGKMGTLTDLLGTGEAATALGGVITALLDKLSHAVGWYANHDTPNRVAINTYIAEIQNSNIDPLIKAARISNAKKIIREYCNQENIVSIAIQSVKSDAKPENIDADWLAQFMDKARLVSSEEFQLIWGKILANECNEPGCVPRALLEILPRMDKEDAENFSLIYRMAIRMGKSASPIIDTVNIDKYAQWGLALDTLIDLTSLGLINTNSNSYFLASETGETTVQYFDEIYPLSETKRIAVGGAIFTKAGKALYHSICVEKLDGFYEKICLPYWKRAENELCNMEKKLQKYGMDLSYIRGK